MTTNTNEVLELLNATQLIAATNEHAKNGTLLDFIRPNGKRLADCTGAECRQAGEWMMRMMKVAERLNNQRKEPR